MDDLDIPFPLLHAAHVCLIVVLFMREEERTRRERGSIPRQTKRSPKETPTRRRRKSSRVACRAFSPPDDSQKRSAIDSNRPRHTRRRDDARARAFLPSRALDRAPFSTSLSAHPHFLLVVFSLHPERDSRAPNTATGTKKRSDAPTRDLRTPAQPPSLARS